MKATEQLTAEHRGVLAMLDSFEVILDGMAGGKAPDRSELASIVEFFSVFVDKCHHGKEEELLFPALVAAGVGKEGGPIGVMLDEHEKGRTLVRAMSAVLANPAADSGAWADFVNDGRAYAAFLRAHIVKEEAVVFSLADRLLGADAQAGMFESFEEIEEKRIGAGRHEAFHALIGTLAAKYAGA